MTFLMGSAIAQEKKPNPVVTRSYEIQCIETEVLLSGLLNRIKERPVVIGTSSDKVIFMVWRGLTNDDFTVTITSENKKMSCVLVEGNNLKIIGDKDTTF